MQVTITNQMKKLIPVCLILLVILSGCIRSSGGPAIIPTDTAVPPETPEPVAAATAVTDPVRVKRPKYMPGELVDYTALDGDTLRIRYSKPGRLPKRLPNKELTVMLPEDIALNDVTISAASAAVSIPAIHADHLDLDVTSGNINAAAKVKTVSAETTSGHIDLHITDSVKEVSAVTTSGSVTIDAGNADRFTAESTSGSIRVTLKNVGDFKASSTSGDIFAEILKAKQSKRK